MNKETPKGSRCLPLTSIDLLCAACQTKVKNQLKQNLENLEYETNREFEIRWYRQFGKYPERITKDRSGQQYMVGDWSWNRNYPEKAETVEPLLRLAKTT